MIVILPVAKSNAEAANLVASGLVKLSASPAVLPEAIVTSAELIFESSSSEIAAVAAITVAAAFSVYAPVVEIVRVGASLTGVIVIVELTATESLVPSLTVQDIVRVFEMDVGSFEFELNLIALSASRQSVRLGI